MIKELEAGAGRGQGDAAAEQGNPYCDYHCHQPQNCGDYINGFIHDFCTVKENISCAPAP
jgi:hypothetical protein